MPNSKYPDSISLDFLASLKDDKLSLGDNSHAFNNATLPGAEAIRNILQSLGTDPRVDMTVVSSCGIRFQYSNSLTEHMAV